MSWVDAYRRDAGRLDGHCLCGAVTVRVDGPHLAGVGACHCDMCQRWSGALYATFSAPAASVTIDGVVTRFASSDFAERAFCPTCGSHLWYRPTNKADADYDLMPGLFGAARHLPMISEIYHDKAPAYAALAGDHRRATQAEYEARNTHVKGDDT